jgi:hypothetical protein
MTTQNTNSGKFRLNLTPDEISLKNAMERTLGVVYQEDIDRAFYQDDKKTLHHLIALTKEHIFG